MKKYFYTRNYKGLDRNGNCKDTLNFFEMKKGNLVLLNSSPVRIYTAPAQDLCEWLFRNRKWRKPDLSKLDPRWQAKEIRDIQGRYCGFSIISGMSYNPVSWKLHMREITIQEIPVPR